MNSSRTRKVTIPASILKELNALPNKAVIHEVAWTAEMDAVLLATWGVKSRADMLALFAKHYGVKSLDTLRKRYKRLQEAL